MLFIIPGFSFLISLQTLRCVFFFFLFLLFAHVVFFCLRDVDAALSLAPVEQTQRHRRRRCSRDLYWLVVVSTSFPGFTQTSWEDTHGCDSRSLS